MNRLSSFRVDIPVVSDIDKNKKAALADELLDIYSAIRSLQADITQFYGANPPNFDSAQLLDVDSIYSASEFARLKVKASAPIVAYRALHLSVSGEDFTVRHTSGSAALDTCCVGLSEQDAAAGEYFFVKLAPAIITTPFDLVPALPYYSWVDGGLINDTSAVPILPEGNANLRIGVAVGRRKMRILGPAGVLFSS